MVHDRRDGWAADEADDQVLGALAGGGHAGHAHGRRPLSPGGRRIALLLLVGAAVATLVAMALLWPNPSEREATPPGPTRLTGQVHVLEPGPCPPSEGQTAPARPDPATGCGTVLVRVHDGPDAGTLVATDVPFGPGAPTVRAGDEVVLMYLPDAEPDQRYQIADHRRDRQLWILGVALALAVIGFGRWRGLAALAGLAVTFTILLFFIVPAILSGRPPLLVAIVGSAAIMLTVLYLTHGFNRTTTVAVFGTLTSLVLTGVLAAIATAATHLTGIASEEETFVSATHLNVNMQGLLLAGILIGALGVLDDVAVTQAATVDELAQANPALGGRQLYRAAGRVGRAHIASVINTIILAYAGASLPLLLLFAEGGQAIGDILTNQLVAQEIVRSVVGTLGLIAAVPLTTALAAFTARVERT
ncbi:MAG TPA: YibE/F family protein [Micromonosporaceae bacterium]|nr:YibE/F family protein [Micromonosporaceae bacterium]